MTVKILANLTTNSPLLATGTWTEMTGLSASGLQVAGNDSVLLIIASLAQLGQADNTAEYRIKVNGSGTASPVLTTFSDAGNETGNTTLAVALTGTSGETDIAVEWRTVSGSPARDVGRDSSLMILEVTGGDAVLQADLASVAAFNPTATWTELFGTGNIDINSTSSIVLLIANVQIAGAADAGFECQFSVDDTQEGAITGCYTDASDEMTGWSGVHVLTGLSAGNHTFELMIQDRYGTPLLDTTRQRTFQVVELKVGTLEVDLVTSAAYIATIGWNDDTTLDVPVSVDGTDSILLQIANMNHTAGADRTAGFRLNGGGIQRGADLEDFSDNIDRAGRTLLGAAITGLSGTQDFKVQWEEVSGEVTADTARARSMFVIQFPPTVTIATTLRAYLEEITYDIEGIVYTKDGDPYLGAAQLFLFKDNGDNTLTFVDYTIASIATGAYSFSVTDEDDYLIAAFGDATPNVFDVTDHNLLPKLIPTESYDLYLRSDVDKGETPVSTNLRLRTQADKMAQAVEIATTLRGHLSEHLTIATTLRGHLSEHLTIASTLRGYLYKHVTIATDLRGYLQQHVEVGSTLRAYLQQHVEIATTLRGHLSERVLSDSTLRAYLQKSDIEVATTLRGYLQKSDIEVATDLRGYLQALDVEIVSSLRAYLNKRVQIATTLRAYLQKSDIEIATTLRGHLSEHLTIATTLRGHLSENIEVATTLRGHLSENVEIASSLRGYLQKSDIEIATDLRAWLSAVDIEVVSSLRAYLTSQQVVPTTLRAWLSAVDLEITTDLRGHLSEHLTIGSTLRGYLFKHQPVPAILRAWLQAVDVEIATTLRGHLSEHLTIASTLRGYLQKSDVEVATDLRGYLQKHQPVPAILRAWLSAVDLEVTTDLRGYLQKSDIEVVTTLRGHLSENVTIDSALRGHLSEHLTIASSLRAYLSKLDIEVATTLRAYLTTVTHETIDSSLRGYLQALDVEVVSTLRAYLAEHVEIVTTLRGYLQKSDIETATALRAYLQKLDVEVSSTLRAHLATHVSIASTLRAYLFAARTESTDLRAYLSALARETKTTLSAYLQEFTFEPHECFKASPRDKFVASPREKFASSGKEKFSSSPDSCPFREN